MTSLSPIPECAEETSAAAERLEAAERLRRHEVDLAADLGLPDRLRPSRASTPLPRLNDTTIIDALNQSMQFSPGWMWCSLDSGIRQPDDDLVSTESKPCSTVEMASLDVSWASGSLDLDAPPQQSADDPVAVDLRQRNQQREDSVTGDSVYDSSICSVVDAS